MSKTFRQVDLGHMIRTRDGRPFASSLVSGLACGVVVAAAGVVRAWNIDTPHHDQYLWLVVAPFLLGLCLVLIRSWRSFAIGLMVASVAVAGLGLLLLYIALSNLPYS